MEEENFYERIERIRGNIEGYELKVKPKVEFLSALLGVFEEKIRINPALAIKVSKEKLKINLETSDEPCYYNDAIPAMIEGYEVNGIIEVNNLNSLIYKIEEGERASMDELGRTLLNSKSKLLSREIFCELITLYGKEEKLIEWLSRILEPIEGFRAIVIEGLKTYIETIYPVERIRLGRTIYCKRDFKGENRWIPTRIEIETEPPTERATSAVKMKIIDDTSNEWKANLYFYEPEGLVNLINELTKGIGYLFKRTSVELDS